MDQFAPAVLESKTVHTAQAHKYSNTFQMNRLTGHYEGNDLITFCDRGKFEKSSLISWEWSLLTVASRPDIASHITSLGEQGVIPWSFAESVIDDAKARYSEEDLKILQKCYANGGTSVPLHEAMELEKNSGMIKVTWLLT